MLDFVKIIHKVVSAKAFDSNESEKNTCCLWMCALDISVLQRVFFFVYTKFTVQIVECA